MASGRHLLSCPPAHLVPLASGNDDLAVNFAHDLLSSVTEWAILITTRNLVWIVHRTAIGLLWIIVVGAKGVFAVINALVWLWDWLRHWSFRIVLYMCCQPFVLWANSIHGHSKWW